MARSRRHHALNPVIFIACEGTSTEFDYFDSWAKEDIVQKNFENVDVYPSSEDENPKTTPFQLFGKAHEEMTAGAANNAWIVFDRDNHPRLPETFSRASEEAIRIAFSSRSFEQWVLLHFRKENIAFNATECKIGDTPINCGTEDTPDCNPINCLTGHIRRQNYIPNYSKKRDFDLYSAIKQRTEIAIVNSAWLRFQVTSSINNLPQPALYTLNPYTDVDQLILFLLGRNDILEWGNSGTDVQLNDWVINARISQGNILLQISHKKPKAIILKKQIEQSSFFTTDDELNDSECAIISKSIDINTKGSDDKLLYAQDRITYVLNNNNQPYFLFKVEQESIRIYISL